MNEEGESGRQVAGRKLREARLKQGLSLREVEQSIKVHTRHLNALERGDFAALPNPFWARGFLETYANWLGLEEERLPETLFPVQRTSQPRRFLGRRWRGLIAALSTIAIASMTVLAAVVAPYNGFTGWIGGILHDLAPGTFLDNKPQRVVVLGSIEVRTTAGQNVLMAEVAEGGLDLVAIPRDTETSIPGHGRGDIADAFALGGPDLVRRSVARLTDAPVPSYFAISSEGVKEIVDRMGGVQVEVARSMSGKVARGGPKIELRPGPQTLTGDQALVYLQGVDLVDSASRAKRQQSFLYAMYRQALGPSNLLEEPSTLNAVLKNTETNLSGVQMVQMASRIRAVKSTQASVETHAALDRQKSPAR